MSSHFRFEISITQPSQPIKKMRPTKRQRIAPATPPHELGSASVPTFDAATEWSKAIRTFQKYRVVLLKNAWKGIGDDENDEETTNLTTNIDAITSAQDKVFAAMRSICHSNPPDLMKTWTVENDGGDGGTSSSSLAPSDIFPSLKKKKSVETNNQDAGGGGRGGGGGAGGGGGGGGGAGGVSSSSQEQWYASFILKTKPVVRTVLPCLPLQVLPPPSSIDAATTTTTAINTMTNIRRVRHGNAVWFFVGKNQRPEGMLGRPEHTDAVSHDGTWHFQVCGTKIWHLRPTEQLCQNYLDTSWNSQV